MNEQLYKLKLRQAMDLDNKIMLSKKRIIDWYIHYNGKVYISFSGGKDSTVLLHLVRETINQEYGKNKGDEISAVFCDTGLEFPEIKTFVKTIDNVVFLKPKINFKDVINKYGYPVISKEQSSFLYEIKKTQSKKLINIRLNGNKYNQGKISNKWRFLINAPFKISSKCCDYMKKKPFYIYEKQTNNKAFLGVMASESMMREKQYIIYGCNSFNTNRPISKPISFWVEKDIWEYIKKYNINYSKIYDIGYYRTGCMFCMYGCHLEKYPNRFQKMQKTHPKIYDYCMRKENGLNMKEILNYIGVDCENLQLEFDFYK